MMSNSNNTPLSARLALMVLSLSIVSSIAIVTPNGASAQEDPQQRGLLGGLEREQSDEAIPGQQLADIGGSAPLNRTIAEGTDGAESSACAPTQTGGVGGNQTAGVSGTTTGGAASTGTTNATSAATAGGGVGGNQSTSSSIELIEQACMALQGGDIQGAMMQLNLAIGQLRDGGGAQGESTTGGAASTTTGPGGIGTDDPSATDNPFSDFT